MKQDLEHLRLLSIFHYVVAGMAGLFACFPIFHLAIGISMLSGNMFGEPVPDDFPARLFGAMFTLIPLAIIILGWVFAVCLALAGWYLSKRQRYTFCLVVAAISCIFTPFGTVLGILTLIKLTQPQIKLLFGKGDEQEVVAA